MQAAAKVAAEIQEREDQRARTKDAAEAGACVAVSAAKAKSKVAKLGQGDGDTAGPQAAGRVAVPAVPETEERENVI